VWGMIIAFNEIASSAAMGKPELLAAGIGTALIALVWREGPAVARWVEQGLAAASDVGSLGTFAFVSLGIGTWVALQRLMPR